MRFNSVIKPSVSLILSSVGMEVTQDANSHAFSVGYVLNLIPVCAMVSVTSIYVFALCETADETLVFFLQKHAQGHAVLPKSAQKDNQV